MKIDVNCDLGEARDPAQREIETRVIPWVSSVNVACGVHAGDHESMRRVVRLAKAHGVAIGAHPGLRDPESLGRRPVTLAPDEIESLVAYQIGALMAIATLEQATLSHVKPHGALYNTAAREVSTAAAIARAVAAVDRRLVLVGLAGSELIAAAERYGLRTASEAFADRAYLSDGTLVSRDQPGAVLHDEREVVRRVLGLVREHRIADRDGKPLALRPDTICLHGDTPGADHLAQAIRRALEDAGVRVEPLVTSHA